MYFMFKYVFESVAIILKHHMCKKETLDYF